MADNKTWQDHWQDYRYKTYNKQYNRYKKTRGSALNALLQHPLEQPKPTFNQIHDARAERIRDEKKQEQALINKLLKNYF